MHYEVLVIIFMKLRPVGESITIARVRGVCVLGLSNTVKGALIRDNQAKSVLVTSQ